jgi:hypothetical protein
MTLYIKQGSELYILFFFSVAAQGSSAERCVIPSCDREENLTKIWFFHEIYYYSVTNLRWKYCR